MMKYLRYIALAGILLLAAACAEKENIPAIPTDNTAESAGKVKLKFSIVAPTSVKTKADIDANPDLDNIYVAVFSASGFFNEWVPATIENTTEVNYDGTAATKYELTVSLTMSESRLRVHFIGNCPEKFKSAPPITGISAQDLEEIVMSKIRSQITDTHNDGYWQKVLLPKGIKAQTTVDEFGTEVYATDPVTGDFMPTAETLAQFPDPIVLVRNFARIYLENLATNDQGVKDVTIQKFALAYAPAEGPIAPILMNPVITDSVGVYVPNPDAVPNVKTYMESFFINFQDYPLVATTEKPVALADEPYFYEAHTPANLVFGTYPDPNDPNKDPNVPTFAEMTPWTAGTALYMYERELPKRGQPATRIIIYAHKDGEVDGQGNDLYKYYALDIVNESGEYIPIMRNNTYTIKLLNIEAGSGESSLDAAAGASSATVYGDINKQHVTEISNGVSSIGTSYTEMMYVRPGTYEVMFRYIATNDTNYDFANKERLDLVSLQIGYKDESSGAFTLQPESTPNLENAFLIDNGKYKVYIDTVAAAAQRTVIQYVRSGHEWVQATAAQIADPNVHKWGKIVYQTIGTSSDGLMDSDGYFTQSRVQTIRVTGTFDNKPIFRDVIIKLSPRRTLQVVCRNKYVMAESNQREVVRIRVPDDLSRSIFPLQFKIEPAAHSLTPDGDVLPVTSGASIVPNASEPAYYFIKELTWEAYEAMRTSHVETINGVKWVYIDCTFKTTKTNNACTVYVRNDYFKDDANAQDDFQNYYQRSFSDLSFGQSGTDITFSCTLDKQPASGMYNSTYWWDPSLSDNCFSNSYRVLPYAFKIVLDGIEPKLNAQGRPVDEEIQGTTGENTYLVIVGNPSLIASGTNAVDNPDRRFISLTFAVSEDNTSGNYSIDLNTTNLTDNPNLYIPNSASGRVKTKVPRTVTVNTTSSTVSNTGDRTITSGNVSIRFTNIYARNSGYITIGDNSRIIITAGDLTITGITINYRRSGNTTYYSAGMMTGTGYADNTAYNPPRSGSWSGSATSVELQNGTRPSGGNRVQITSIAVTYEDYE